MVILLSGCSHIPEVIRQAPLHDIQIQDVATGSFSVHQNKIARWGGKLLDVTNDEASSTLQLLAFPLNSYGKPNLNASPLGRFLVRSREFLDPARYTNDSELTISGRLVGVAARKVGQKTLKLAVIEPQKIYIWPEYQPMQYGYSPTYDLYRYDSCLYGRPYSRSYGYYGYRHYFGHERHYY